MKNKKLFAILTLVCFMFTLMPVAAFAADPVLSYKQGNNGTITLAYTGTATTAFGIEADGTTSGSYTIGAVLNAADVNSYAAFGVDADTKVTLSADTKAAAATQVAYVAYQANKNVAATPTTDVATDAYNAFVKAYKASNGAGVESNAKLANAIANAGSLANAKAVEVAMANAGVVYNADSTFATVKADLELEKYDEGKALITLKDATGVPASATIYVWAEVVKDEVSAAFVASAATGVTPVTKTVGSATVNTGVYQVTVAGDKELGISFTAPGTYSLKASVDNPVATGVAAKDIEKLTAPADFNTVVVEDDNLDTSKFQMTVAATGIGIAAVADEKEATGAIVLKANGVNEEEVTLTFKDENGDAVVGYTVEIETNSAAIEVSKATAVTNYKGQVTFEVSGTIEGDYEINVVCEDFDAVINVTVGSTSAAYIEFDAQPKAPQALYGQMADDAVTFVITDINGNVVDSFADGGMDGINGNDGNNTQYKGKYIVLTEKPADSDLVSKDLTLVYDSEDGVWGIDGIDKDAEGHYAVKVILDNGAYATAEWDIKKFQTPVKMYFNAGVPAQVELGRVLAPQVKYVDVNGVEKDATDVTFAGTGYAIQNSTAKTFTLKTDEKYVGSEVTITAVSEKYDLAIATTVKIVEVKGIVFETEDLEVNVNNKIDWMLADENGKVVRVNNVKDVKVSAIVVEKPEGAKVSVSAKADMAKGFNSEGELSLTSNKVGNVVVQMVVQLTMNNNATNETNQTRYYTVTKVFAVGTDSADEVVVMSIGSSELVKNDEVIEIPAPAVIKDARTFVPFRALTEAFGAEVAWDAATQSVTAELNGVTVVLTIGANAYTVNGVEKTADVAPFIAGDGYTMVPARFIAEAFGYTVLFTENPDGSVADVLFF